MPTRKIAEPEKEDVCINPEHNPPAMAVFSPGTWEHECPDCGKRTRFIVQENVM